MDEERLDQVSGTAAAEFLRFDPSLVGSDAIMKASYWFSRHFFTNVTREGSEYLIVELRPKSADVSMNGVAEDFRAAVTDFELRGRIAAQTSKVRELLLMKAFTESGILEDQPEGIFGDSIEESDPNGIFKILNNG